MSCLATVLARGGTRSQARMAGCDISSLKVVAAGRSPLQGMATRWRRLARALQGYLNPSPQPTPSARQPGGGVSQGQHAAEAALACTWAGRWGGEEGKTPGPPCPLAPGRERQEQDIPCPRTQEGRGGELP